MRIAIIGSSGYIAKKLIKSLERREPSVCVLKVGRNDTDDFFLDLNDLNTFDASLFDFVDMIIFTAAVSSPDKCSDDYDNSWKTNVIGTCYFIRQALINGCKTVFLSSDAVYGVDSKTVFYECDKTCGCTAYGIMKKKVEDEFASNPLFKSVRLSYVVSSDDKFVTYCLNCIKENKIAEIYHPFYRNAVVISDVLDAIVFLINNWDDFGYSFLNVAGNELVSRVRIADEINEYYGDLLQYSISIPPSGFFAKRPKRVQMSSMFIKSYGIISEGTFSEKFANELRGTKL